MGAVPFDVQIRAAIVAVDQQIAQARRDLSPYTLNDAPIPIAQLGAYTNLLERRHALELQRTYPNARVYTQLTFGPVMGPEGEAVRLRGARRRRPDMGVLNGDTLYLVEAKVLHEILDMFPKGSKARRSMEAQLKKSSSFGAQWKKESSLLRRALRRGAYIAFNGTEVLSGRRVELPLVPTTEVHGSHAQVYRNMGDGLPIQGPGTPAAPTVKRVHTLDLQPSADAIRAAKLNRPVKEPEAKPRTGSTVTPEDLRRAKATGGVVIPKVKHADTPARAVTPQAPVGDPMVERRGTPKTPDPQRRTFETQPSTPWGKRIGSNVRATMAQGLAQAFHDFMERGMHRSAREAAERAASRKVFRDEVFAARHSGAWVLVEAHFAESKVPDPAGSRLLLFRKVDFKMTYAVPGEDPERTLHRLRNQQPRQVYRQSWHRPGERGPSDNFDWEGWRSVSQEMALYPGDPTEEVVSEPHPSGLGVGRCTVRRLR